MMESEVSMGSEDSRLVPSSEASRALSDAVQHSEKMLATSESSMIFGLGIVAIMSTLVSLRDVASGTSLLWISALFVPLLLWQWARQRRRAKPRTVLKGSGRYGLHFLASLMLIQCLLLWTAQTGWEIGAKWIVSFSILWVGFTRMQSALDEDRVREGQEQLA